MHFISFTTNLYDFEAKRKVFFNIYPLQSVSSSTNFTLVSFLTFRCPFFFLAVDSSVKASGKKSQAFCYVQFPTQEQILQLLPSQNSCRGQGVSMKLQVLQWKFSKENFGAFVSPAQLKVVFLNLFDFLQKSYQYPFITVCMLAGAFKISIFFFSLPLYWMLYNTRIKYFRVSYLQKTFMFASSPAFHFCNKTYFT